MTSYLNSKGYKSAIKETLGNKEYRHTLTNIIRDDELSTFNNNLNIITKTYELYLSNMTYSESIIDEIVDDMRVQDKLIECNIDVEQQEKGYLLALTFIIRG